MIEEKKPYMDSAGEFKAEYDKEVEKLNEWGEKGRLLRKGGRTRTGMVSESENSFLFLCVNFDGFDYLDIRPLPPLKYLFTVMAILCITGSTCSGFRPM